LTFVIGDETGIINIMSTGGINKLDGITGRSIRGATFVVTQPIIEKATQISNAL
jgi:hypothetical protein